MGIEDIDQELSELVKQKLRTTLLARRADIENEITDLLDKRLEAMQ